MRARLPGEGHVFSLRLRAFKPYTRERRKRDRLARPRYQRPGSFRFRGTLADIGGIRRLMLLHRFEVSMPRRDEACVWSVEAIAPPDLSRGRLRRFGNLIDRSFPLWRLTSVNVRLFGWLGIDRRQPVAFYDARHAARRRLG